MAVQRYMARRGSAVIVGLACAVAGRAQASSHERYVDLAAAPDGSAWLIVDRGAGLGTQVRRIERDGTMSAVALDGTEQAEAVTLHGEDLWIVTAREVIVRRSSGTTRVALTPHGASLWPTHVTVLGADRAIVARSCAGNDGPVPGVDCSELIEVGLAPPAASSRLFTARIPGMASDGRGGAWAIVSRTGHFATSAYAHLGAKGWDSWTFNKLVVDGMTDRGVTAGYPELIVPSPPGFLGLSHARWFTVDEAGRARGAERRPGSFIDRGEAMAAVLVDDSLAIVSGYEHVITPDLPPYEDASPVVRWWTRGGVELRAEQVPTPQWWRDAHEVGTPRVVARAAGDTLWLLADDLVMRRDARAWRTFDDGRPRPPKYVGTAVRATVSSTFGWARAGSDDSFAFSLRAAAHLGSKRPSATWSAGPYVELGWLDSFAVGGGASVTGFSENVAATLSAGGELVRHDGAAAPRVVASLFVGLRPRIDVADFPVGVRFDYRPAVGDLPTTYMVGVNLDLLVPAAVLSLLTLL